MIIGFVLILSIVGIALATALYSNFLPYFSLLSDIKNYNMAYYGANTAIERSFLVLRYQEAGFEGKGGWEKGNISYPVDSDKLGTNPFAYYNADTTMLWSIIGRPTDATIPGANKGNIDYYFLSGRQNDYNTLSYRIPQRIPLRVDSTDPDKAYVGDHERTPFHGSKLSLITNLTPSVKDSFNNNIGDGWRLDKENDIDGDGVGDDVIVDRGWKGQYSQDGGSTWSDFSILPRSLVAIASGDTIAYRQSDDESIREEDINTMSSSSSEVVFTTNINPLKDPSGPINNLRNSEKSSHSMVSDDSVVSTIGDYDFEKLLTVSQNEINNQELNLFLTKNMTTSLGNIYPFLEYNVNIDGDPQTISQPYFTINGKSQVGQYTVQMNVKKSINKDATLGSFTVVF